MAWTGLALVLLVAANVLGRYFIGLSTVAAQELEWHLLAVGALFGMAYGLNQGGEVRVDVFFARFRPGVQALIDLLTALILLAISLYVVHLSLGFVEQSRSIGEGSPDPGGLPNRWILKAAIPAAFALLALQAAAMALRAAARLSR
jgi:TRAP-type mannitol/chloroaromatic compound transport system permease small subunit